MASLDRRLSALETATKAKSVYEMTDAELLAAMGLPVGATLDDVERHARERRALHRGDDIGVPGGAALAALEGSAS